MTKVIRIEKTGGPEVMQLVDVDLPKPGHGEVRIKHTADTSFLGLSAARLAGSGVGIGIQAKGTAVIHQKDRLPHHNLELFSKHVMPKLKAYKQPVPEATAA